MILLNLFWEFFKTGLFAVGGGPATLPFLQKMGLKTGWFTMNELANMVAVSESTPGPIGVNMATYVGYTTAGIPGGIIATLGLITPSVIIILIVAMLLRSFRNNFYVNSAFYGLRAASSGLIAAALWTMLSIAVVNVDLFRQTGVFTDLVSIKSIVLAAVLLYLMRWCKWTKKLHPILFIGLSAVAGILFSF